MKRSMMQWVLGAAVVVASVGVYASDQPKADPMKKVIADYLNAHKEQIYAQNIRPLFVEKGMSEDFVVAASDVLFEKIQQLFKESAGELKGGMGFLFSYWAILDAVKDFLATQTAADMLEATLKRSPEKALFEAKSQNEQLEEFTKAFQAFIDHMGYLLVQVKVPGNAGYVKDVKALLPQGEFLVKAADGVKIDPRRMPQEQYDQFMDKKQEVDAMILKAQAVIH